MDIKNVWIRILKKTSSVTQKVTRADSKPIVTKTDIKIKPIEVKGTGTKPGQAESNQRKTIGDISVSKAYATVKPVQINVNVLGMRQSIPTFGNFTSIGESFQVLESVTFDFGFGREHNESFILDERISFSINKLILDSFIVADTLSYTVASDLQNGPISSFNFLEQLNFSVNKSINESFTFNESISKNYGKNIAESISFSDSLVTTRDINSIPLESFNFLEVVSKNVQKNPQEAFRVSDTLSYELMKMIVDEFRVGDQFAHSSASEGTYNRSEALSFMEVFSVALDKLLSEGISVAESISKDVGKNPTEVISFIESFRFDVSKSVQEGLSLQESFSIAVSRSVSEGVNFSENVTKNTGKNPTESVTFTETLEKEILKLIQEFVLFSDSALTQKAGEGEYSDQSLFSLVESVSKAFDKPTAEVFNLVETVVKDYSKVTSEGMAFIENQSFNVSKNIQSYVSFGDVATRIIDGDYTDYEFDRNETLTFSEAGLINKQDYVESGYFLEDYVGSNYTF